MNNRDIPADKINEAVARALNLPIYSVDSERGTVWLDVWEGGESVPFAFRPLANHNQFHKIWTPEMEAKACDVLQEWLGEHYEGSLIGDFAYWHHPKYQSNRRLWQLRAYCEVIGNEG